MSLGVRPRAHLNPIVATLATVFLVSTLVTVPSVVSADTAPPVAATPETVSTDSLPTAQIDGVVWDQVLVGNTVFAGGSFTTARPAGADAGSGTVARSNLLSYNLTTGALTSWAPTLNGQVRALDVSPDGNRLYAVGQFTLVNGVARNRIVAFDTATGAVVSGFKASANGQVFAVTASASAVYFGGQFTATLGVQRPGGAAAASASNGSVLPWAPTLSGGRAFAMEVAPDNSKVVIAGNFTAVNGSGNPGYGMGAVDTVGGASAPWAVGSLVRVAGPDAAVYNLDSDAQSVYGSTYTFGGGGNLEGAFKASWAGNLEWIDDCRGDSYSIAVAGSAVYVAGHPHDCSRVGDFPQTEPWTWYRGIAFSKTAPKTIQTGTFAGRPAPTMLHFYPTINAGTFTGQGQGPWSVAGNSDYVVFAGEFTEVNGVRQQGLARFATKGLAPNDDGPRAFANSWSLDATSYGSGTIRLSWPSNHDRDNQQLTYRVTRDGTVIHTVSAPSSFWDRPTLTYVDSGLTPGATYSYRVSATDPWGNIANSNTVSGTANSSGVLSSYARTVLADNPTYYFRLGEPSGSAVNWAGPVANTTQTGAVTQVVNATVGSGASRNQAGAIVGDDNASTRFNNNTASRAYTSAQVWSDDSISVEAWFRTSASSGKIIGFGNSANASNSTTYDRHLYLNGGRVYWGVADGGNRTIQSSTGMNNNQWHHVVGTVGPAGMSLFVDGQLVASQPEYARGARYWGNWHIGGDRTWAGNENFTGEIDEVAIFKQPLSASRVLDHYQSGRGAPIPPPPANIAPTASFTASVAGLSVATNSAASTDSDGTIVSRVWNFGDGSTATGTTASRTFAAAGTYTVTLTVTDDDGATSTTAQQVTVAGATTPPIGGPIAQDGFTRSSASGWGTAEIGGLWLATTGAASVNGSSGVFTHSAGSTRRALLPATTSTADITADVAIDRAATGGGVSVGVVGRQVGSAFYQSRIRFNADGSVGLQLLSGSSTVLANTAINGLTYTPGQQLRLRVQVTGTNPTTIRSKVWAAGAIEPASWQLNITSTIAELQSAGSIGVESYLSGSASNSPVGVVYDNFTAVAAQ